jgi:dynein intermediate chain, cytosolic
MSTLQEELLAKKARLAELKRQRELRQEQLASKRISIGGDVPSPGRSAEERRTEIDHLVSRLIDRKRDRDSIGASPNRRDGSRPSSSYGTGQVTPDAVEPSHRPQMSSMATQTLPEGSAISDGAQLPEPTTVPPPKEYITYTKGVQTDPISDDDFTPDGSDEDDVRKRSRRRSSRRDAAEEEEIRASLRKEVEEELRAAQAGHSNNTINGQKQRFPLRTLTDTELNAVTASTEFASFVERSSKVIERALDEEYDLLADYTRAAALAQDDDEDMPYAHSSRKAHSLRESIQLFSDKHSRRRMVSDIQFSPHFNELLLTAYTKNPSAPNESPGQVLLWNVHAPSRPEYVFACGSDVLSARFSPFHPNYVIGGCYSGQICLWDTRSNNPQPVQRTPQSGSHLGHTHPVYNISIIGTPNAHNILTASMDGVVCSWSFDMLTQAQEYLVLHTPPPAKTEDLAPTALSFPAADPTFFLVGTEEGSIYPCHRYDRAGAKAGVDTRLAYRGHTAPVMSTHFHPARGPVDLGDLLLSSSSDWSLKLWRVKPAASSFAAAATASSLNTLTGTPSNQPTALSPLLDIGREDLVYDAKWHPHRPSIFATVTGAGELEVFDLLYDTEVPVTKASPTRGKNGVMPFRGLNKVAWDERRGANIAVGGLDGVVTLFETGKGLQGASGEGGAEDWMNVRRLVSRLEGKGT